MKCANCSRDMKLSGIAVGRNHCCSGTCANSYARAELIRLEKHLQKISAKARGLGRSLAMQALYSNQDPT